MYSFKVEARSTLAYCNSGIGYHLPYCNYLVTTDVSIASCGTSCGAHCIQGIKCRISSCLYRVQSSVTRGLSHFVYKEVRLPTSFKQCFCTNAKKPQKTNQQSNRTALNSSLFGCANNITWWDIWQYVLVCFITVRWKNYLTCFSGNHSIKCVGIVFIFLG